MTLEVINKEKTINCGCDCNKSVNGFFDDVGDFFANVDQNINPFYAGNVLGAGGGVTTTFETLAKGLGNVYIGTTSGLSKTLSDPGLSKTLSSFGSSGGSTQQQTLQNPTGFGTSTAGGGSIMIIGLIAIAGGLLFMTDNKKKSGTKKRK